MGNGFLINISNSNNQVKEIILFHKPLPEGILIKTLDSRHDFESLLMAAIIKPFIGNILTSNTDVGIQIEIVRYGLTEKIILQGRFESSEIVIDGQDNFIKIFCPSNSNFYIRLNSISTEYI